MRTMDDSSSARLGADGGMLHAASRTKQRSKRCADVTTFACCWASLLRDGPVSRETLDAG